MRTKTIASGKQERRRQLYRLRAAIHGRVFWTCVYCGAFGDSTFNTRSWLAHCAMCDTSFVVGLVFYPRPPGRQRPPHDRTPPQGLREAFPLGELRTWSSGAASHVLAGQSRRHALSVVEDFMDRVMNVWQSSGGTGYPSPSWLGATVKIELERFRREVEQEEAGAETVLRYRTDSDKLDAVPVDGGDEP
jgi:hypothetical protein